MFLTKVGLNVLGFCSSCASRKCSGYEADEVLQVLMAQVRKFVVSNFIVVSDVEEVDSATVRRVVTVLVFRYGPSEGSWC